MDKKEIEQQIKDYIIMHLNPAFIMKKFDITEIKISGDDNHETRIYLDGDEVGTEIK
jgi:hypothetical protein